METTVKPCQFTVDGKVLLLKCINKDFTSYEGLQWPKSGLVEAPDWNPKPDCGGGLHGWPWGIGIGNGKIPCYSSKSVWLVFSADPNDIVDLGGKAKCRKCEVILYGTFFECYTRIVFLELVSLPLYSSSARAPQ